ncbi:YbaN family protein [Paeniclostridium hominis]|uniref:YbaN family protein n=1 Tax=Paeniclostridium hominis TaxID=2764329 RepID=UPI0022E585A2|nr:YbaN family protein [Paeniclostridium hominis]
MNKIKKYIYVTVGLLSFAIGAIGVILPILPTTPFLLLASFCFVRGSEKFDRWFKSTKMYKNHLERFVNERAMTMKQKVMILLFVNVMLAIPIILVDNLHMRLFLLGLICIKLYYFIFKIKTIKPCSVNE